MSDDDSKATGNLRLNPELREKLNGYKSLTDEKKDSYESYSDVVRHLIIIFETTRDEFAINEPRFLNMKPRQFRIEVLKMKRQEEEVREVKKTDEERQRIQEGG